MSSQHDHSASNGGDGSTPSPTPSSRSNIIMCTLMRSSQAEKNGNGELLQATNVADLSADEVALIFGFLKHNEIMYARVCTTWRDAAKKTLVSSYFEVTDDENSYNALRAMSTSLPNLQQISIYKLDAGNKYSDGEDPDEEQAAHTANYTTYDLNVMSNFRKLRILQVQYNFRALNGRYPALFNFPLLQSLTLSYCHNLKWDLELLSGCPLLRKLWLTSLQQNPTGDLSSWRVLKSTLEDVYIHSCHNIHGNFMELADCHLLRRDIRHIQEDDFPSAETLLLPSTVIGGFGYQFERISDVPSFMQTIHTLLKPFPKASDRSFSWHLSRDSADWYEYEFTSFHPNPPFEIHPVLAGSRWGWRWRSIIDVEDLIFTFRRWQHCEVNWLDPEPSQDSDDYVKYVECLQKIEDETEFYRGYNEPPTEEEYRRLCQRERED